MNIQKYTPKDYDSVIKRWINCRLIKSAKQATKEQLSAFCYRGTFLIYKDESEGTIGTVMGAWDGWRGGETAPITETEPSFSFKVVTRPALS